MKKTILVLFLIVLIFAPALKVCAQDTHNKYDMPNGDLLHYKRQALGDNLDKYSYIYYDYLLKQEYFCISGDCYNLRTFKYDKKTDTYSIDMMTDLMSWNEHEEYKSPDNNGYITHLIFETKLHDNKITVKYKGYASGYVVPVYRNGKTVSAHFYVVSVRKGAPKVIKKHIKRFEDTFLGSIYFNSYIRNIKILADTP